MRHRKAKHQLNRFTSWHQATLKSLARSLLINQSIKTTKARAKAVRSLVEQLISLGKLNTLSAKRKAFAILGDHSLVSLLFAEIAPRFAKRNGGFTRIIGFNHRRGDNAEIVIFELTEIKKKEYKKVKKEKAAQPAEEEKKPQAQAPKEPETHEHKPKAGAKPQKKFLGGIKGIFKKERDAL